MASSASFQQFVASPLRLRHRASTRRTSLVAAATSSAPASAETAPPPATDADRLEPRVEERQGYWVLKEKYRAGINPQEKVKLEKEPMSLVLEDGIRELAQKPLEEIDASKVSKEDIDVRLKWLGLFHRRKHQCVGYGDL